MAILIGGQFNVYWDDDYIAKGKRQKAEGRGQKIYY
jgi:hypothetical protein